MTNLKSKRRSRRVPCDVTVSWMRRGVAVPAVAADINEHGMFIRTSLAAHAGELLQLVVHLPDGALTCCVIARFVGESESGRGIGAELFVIAEGDRRRWSRHYRAALRAMSAPVAPEAEPQHALSA